MRQVAIVSQFAKQYRDLLEKDFKQCQWHCVNDTLHTPHELEQCEIVLGEPGMIAQLLPQLKAMCWCHSSFAGIEPLLAPSLRQNYLLTNTRGVLGPLMSEYVFGYLLALHQHHQQHLHNQQLTHWPSLRPVSLQGKRICFLGSGDIAQHLARTAKHFAMRTFALNRQGHAHSLFDETAPFSQTHALLSQADIVVAILPHTKHTEGLLNRAFFENLKENVIFFNVGRGKCVDEQALIQFLTQCPQAQAVLDVFIEEPLPQASPLWQLDNVRITPHIAAPSIPEHVARIFAGNLQRYLDKQELKYRVDFNQGY